MQRARRADTIVIYIFQRNLKVDASISIGKQKHFQWRKHLRTGMNRKKVNENACNEQKANKNKISNRIFMRRNQNLLPKRHFGLIKQNIYEITCVAQAFYLSLSLSRFLLHNRCGVTNTLFDGIIKHTCIQICAFVFDH